MFWKSLTLVLVGAGCVIAGALIPPAAPALLPVGGVLLLAADPRNILKGPGAPPAAGPESPQ